MTTRFKVDDDIWVPATRVGERDGYALVQRKVRRVEKLSVWVEQRVGPWARIGTRQVHSDDLGFLVVRIGDWSSEATLLDPLAKSVLHNLRLLVPEERIRLVNVRTATEVEHALAHEGATRSYIIIVGHGSKDGRLITIDGGMSPSRVATSMRAGAAKVVVSLACYSGRTGFASTISNDESVRDFVAPFSALHGAAGSTFLQTFLHTHLLLGDGIQASFRRTNAVVTGTHFVHWRDGDKRAGSAR